MIGYLTTYRNNGIFDYELLARVAVEHNSRKLGLPGRALETPTDSSDNGKRLYPGTNTVSPFLNRMQVEAMEQTPFDVTIFTDSDFFLASDFLARVARGVGPNRPLLLLSARQTLDRFLQPYNDGIDNFPFWSTVLVYYNGTIAKQFFDGVRKIRAHWQAYARRFSFSPDIYRNDFAFSLAASSLRVPYEEITLPSVYRCIFTQDQVSSFGNDGPVFEHPSSLDVHAMHKPSLLRSLACNTSEP